MPERDEVPERGHLRKVVREEVLVQLLQQRLKLLVHMFDRTTVKQNEVEHFRPLTHIFLPLGESRPRTLRLRRQILKKRQESTILNIRRLGFQLALNFLKVVEYLLRLLQVVLIGGFEHTTLALLIVKEAEFHLYIHRVFELLYALFHCAEVGRKVAFRLLFHEWEGDRE